MRLCSFLLVLFLAAVCTDPARAQGTWETVTSKEGQFTVEMPKKPNLSQTTTQRGPGGSFKLLMIGAETNDGEYLAFKATFSEKIEEPSAIDTQLSAARDGFAEMWNGKVISEKKVRAEGRLGRDFTIRGKPEGATGVCLIRVRMYLVGNAIYSVAVIAPPGVELPLESGRFLGSLAIGDKKTRAASGKTEAEPAGKELAGWGLAIDPGSDCEVKTNGSSNLAIQVPGTWHDLNPDNGKLNSPRVLREVAGDFIVTVKVVGDFKPGGKSTNPKGLPYNGAGLLVWSDSDNFIRLERGAILRSGKVTTTAAFEEREGGYRGAVHNEVVPGGTCYLRLERKGSRISGAISSDGTNWKKLKPIDTVWPEKLKLGLAAINSSSEPFTVTFEDFHFEGKTKDKP